MGEGAHAYLHACTQENPPDPSNLPIQQKHLTFPYTLPFPQPMLKSQKRDDVYIIDRKKSSRLCFSSNCPSLHLRPPEPA